MSLPPPEPLPPSSPGALRLLARATLLDPHRRRSAMFYAIVVAGAMLVLGATLFEGWLRGTMVRFAVYWLVCAWLTLLAVLLALLDILILRAQARRIRRELRSQLASEEGEQP